MAKKKQEDETPAIKAQETKSSDFYKGDTRKKERGISRIDSDDTHGWFVRIYNESVTYSKLFSDKKLGGRDKAFQAAIEFRDALIKEIGKSYPSRRIVRRDRRNKTGVIGVCRTRKRNHSGTYSEYFSVSWSPEYGVYKCRMFSINKYGEKKAFQMACDWRKKMELEAHGQTWVKMPKEVPQYRVIHEE